MAFDGPDPLPGAIGLLESAIAYARFSLRAVTPAALHRPTPCAQWDVAALLRHVTDSVAALQEAADTGTVSLAPRREPPSEVPLVDDVRGRTCRLLGAWSANDGADLVVVAGSPLTAAVLVATGAVEIAVHGWDLAQACEHEHPIPESLAAELLAHGRLLVHPEDRPRRFARPVPVPDDASAEARLVAWLGRAPDVRRLDLTS